ncbi:MAG: YajG family lipoprotein [Lentisphaerae bacterium]|nr:YajG family lipoprotein [Lentisphaerota bacterium]
MLKKLIAFCLMASLLVLAVGCAITTDSVNLKYLPEQNVAKINGADKVTVAVTLTDSRSTKDKISCKKNGFGMEMAAIISKDNVATLVSGAITDELRNRGFNIHDGNVTVAISLTKFYNDFKLGFLSGSASSEVVCNVQVKKLDGSINYTKVVIGAYTEEGIQICSGENAKKSLEGALKAVVTKLMQDESFIKAIIQAGT